MRMLPQLTLFSDSRMQHIGRYSLWRPWFLSAITYMIHMSIAASHLVTHPPYHHPWAPCHSYCTHPMDFILRLMLMCLLPEYKVLQTQWPSMVYLGLCFLVPTWLVFLGLHAVLIFCLLPVLTCATCSDSLPITHVDWTLPGLTSALSTTGQPLLSESTLGVVTCGFPYAKSRFMYRG